MKKIDLLGYSLLELKKLTDKKEIKIFDVWEYFKKRIEKYNPLLNVFLTVVPTINKERFPLAIKDNFCTRNIRTTASSKVLDNFIPPYESTVTQRLIDSGFSTIGKTNMDAWAHGSSTETSDYGPTKNPWDITRSPGGSSGGSAAAVSAYLAPAAIGSETAGSIRQPAAWSGVIGLKPTYGRVSRFGVIAMGSSLDCPGPFTINVSDAAYLLQIIAGKDEYDATSASIKVDDYLGYLKLKKQYTIGIAQDYFEGIDEDVKNAVMRVIDILKKNGHRIKKIKLISPKYAISVYTIIQRAEVASNLSRYDGIRYGNSREYFGQEAKRRIMLGTFVLSYGYYDAFYKKAQKVRNLIIEDFKKAFKEVDMILAPTTPVTALRLGEFEKYPFFGEMMDVLNEPGAVAGLPAINFPVGLDKNNLPIGAQLMGRWFEEKEILNLSYQLEKETDFFGIIKKGREKYKD
jgi:aspartyl-tRNA(Asn)/glutamyl-tRNA(Gln) amidotransferase subunit A